MKKSFALALGIALAVPAAAHADYWHVAMDTQTHAVSECFPVTHNYPTAAPDDGDGPIKQTEQFKMGAENVVVYVGYMAFMGKNIAHVYTETEATCRAVEAGRVPLSANP
jgi:hypothetical protein